MSRAYTEGGKRRSSQTHSRQAHTCDVCGAIVYGNGGVVSHGRAHVRRGEAVEVYRMSPYLDMGGLRFFLPAGDAARTGEFLSRGFLVVSR
jgi:hypothetical protein